MTPAVDFLRCAFGRQGWPVFRLGLSATYRPGERAVRRALDNGVNYLFGFAIDTNLTRVVREMNADRRENVLLATGAYNWLVGRTSVRKSLENALRRYRTDYIDVFHFLGVLKPAQLTPLVQEELAVLRSEGKVRATAISCHDRKFAGDLSAKGALDAVMVRYNAAERGAEVDIFPHTTATRTGVIAFTATRWGRLLVRPRAWPPAEPVPSAGQCYRFALSHPAVHVVLTAPRSEKELADNLRDVGRGPLADDELEFMRRFGAHVHAHAGWFTGR